MVGSEDYRDSAVHFEAVKIALKQDKNGYVLTLSVHPDDVPISLMKSHVGARYTVAMVQLNELEQPVTPPEKQEGRKAVQRAAIICRDPEFARYLTAETGDPVFGHEDCAETLRGILGLDTRADLAKDEDALATFKKICDDYEVWRRT